MFSSKMQVRTVLTPRSSVEFNFILLKGFQVISFKIKVYFITFLYAAFRCFLLITRYSNLGNCIDYIPCSQINSFLWSTCSFLLFQLKPFQEIKSQVLRSTSRDQLNNAVASIENSRNMHNYIISSWLDCTTAVHTEPVLSGRAPEGFEPPTSGLGPVL